jgi:ribosomal-protein-alanine N-acetyltransferase
MIIRRRRAGDAPARETPEIRRLWPADISRLRLGLHARLDEADAAALVIQSPGASFWVPATGEFLLVTPWRHRSDIITVHTASAFANETSLMRAVIDHGREAGYGAFVLVNTDETRRPAFYARHGLTRLEGIVTYEHGRLGHLASLAPADSLRFQPVRADDRDAVAALRRVDAAAFPWLWRNSPEEFDVYLRYPGVDVRLAWLDGEPVGYTGATVYREWGHLDRIAAHPSHQGRGLGRRMLAMVGRELLASGVRRLALSTQADNGRSRALYASTGFQRTPDDDYEVFGVLYDDEGADR